MERRRKVELFEELRREYEDGCGTIVGVAKRFGVHRRLVRQAIESALPPERKRAARRRPKFAAICEFIDKTLKEDEQAPRKQRHTAHRIYERLRWSCRVCESVSERCGSMCGSGAHNSACTSGW